MTAADLRPTSAPDIMRLDFGDAVNALIAHEDLDQLVDSDPVLAGHLSQRARALAHLAFVLENKAAMEIVHQVLSALYEQHVMPPDHAAVQNQFHPLIITIQHSLEQKWEAYEVARCRLDRNSVPTRRDEFLRFFDHRFQKHAATAHPVYDFLRDDATREQFAQYFTWDGPLNIRFYDILVMSMIGAEGPARQELVENLLDETGRGDDKDAHTSLFKETLDYVGQRYDASATASTLPWRGLAGYNLFLAMALHRRNYFRLLGTMSITEQIDPPNYVKLLEGCDRVGLTDGRKLAYYSLHIIQEVEHGAGWNEHLMLPALSRHPDAAYEIMLGALMRLNTAQDYYDALLEQFRKPA